jgi:ribosomal-protein-alanine N-acetyltransferase
MARKLKLRLMRESDLEQVLRIERLSFTSPWSRSIFLHELRRNPLAVNWVLEGGGRLLGYASAWLRGEELKINNLVVDPDFRRGGLADWMLPQVLEKGRAKGCARAILEVRPSNTPARRLYEKHGFAVIGRLPNYYRLEGEDALVMATALRRRERSG